MTPARLVAAYRHTIRLYPRSFRDEFGDDLVQLFEDQLADEPAVRVVTRTVLDLALSVPHRHLESDMRMTRTTVLPLLFFVAALSSLVVGLVDTAAYSLFGLFVFSITFLVIDLLTPGKLGDTLIEDRFHPAVIVSSVSNIAIAIVISSAIY